MASATFSETEIEEQHETFSRISFNPDGRPVIRGTRCSVEEILERIVDTGTIAGTLRDFPQLTDDDVRQAIRFAAASLKNDIYLSADHP